MAAAVNPDAFSSLAGSPQSQLSIGKSIFYNERINTTGSGLVQVLLVDGSTFTVGPGSDLVIDKFVYDPKKGTGQIAASFSKGVMRFVGGKISKNEGGVTVDTPAGALAIRGGIAYADFKSPKNFSVLFVFGDYIKLQGQTCMAARLRPLQQQWSGDEQAVQRDRPRRHHGGAHQWQSRYRQARRQPNPNTVKLLNTQSLNQLIADANANQIQAQVDEQLANQKKRPAHAQPVPGLCRRNLPTAISTEISNSTGRPAGWDPVQPVAVRGRASVRWPRWHLLWRFVQPFCGRRRVGRRRSEDRVQPDQPSNGSSGGSSGRCRGTAHQSGSLCRWVDQCRRDAITVYDNTVEAEQPPADVDEQLNSGQAVLVGVSGKAMRSVRRATSSTGEHG